MRKYVVILLFNEQKDKVLLVKRNKKPYANLWNGIGGKVEGEETPIDTAIRECKEETSLDMVNPKLYMTCVYPETNEENPGTVLNVVYDFIPEQMVEDNYEGHYEWKDVNFAMDFNNREIAGYSNLAQFIKEIYNVEGIKKFYE